MVLPWSGDEGSLRGEERGWCEGGGGTAMAAGMWGAGCLRGAGATGITGAEGMLGRMMETGLRGGWWVGLGTGEW